MSLTTYKSQFAAVGGRDPSTEKPTDLVFTSDTGEKWQPLLPRMRSKRYCTSSVGTVSPEALVVAGGYDSSYQKLDDVEMLVDNEWHSVAPLPKPCCSMTSTLHQDEVVFTDSYTNTIYSNSVDSIISSSKSLQPSSWKMFEAPDVFTATISYVSRLININGRGTIRGYGSLCRSWIEVAKLEDLILSSDFTSAAALPSGDIVVAHESGVYRVIVSGELFNLLIN